MIRDSVGLRAIEVILMSQCPYYSFVIKILKLVYNPPSGPMRQEYERQQAIAVTSQIRSRYKRGVEERRGSGDRVAEQLEQGGNFDIGVYQKFTEFVSRARIEQLRKRLVEFHGRTYPITYLPKYEFSQKWEGSGSNDDQAIDQIVNTSRPIMQVLILALMLSNWFIIWAITIERVFRGKGQPSRLTEAVGSIGVFSRVVSLLVKSVMEASSDLKHMKKEEMARMYLPQVVCFGYLMLGLLQVSIDSMGWIPLQLAIIVYLYLYASKYYQVLRLTEVFLRYEYQFKVTDLIINLVTITHFISLLMYAVIWLSPNNNWATSIQNFDQSYLNRYLYSFYFCTTTILTVGYGDFSPKNIPQIIVVILMQFFGVIFFGYLINEIGHTLSIMRTKDDELQKDLTTLNKIEKLYRIEKSLANRAKGYLVAHRQVGAELNPQDEKNFFSKLNQDLRDKIMNEKSMSIVKSSIFFLCRWTKQFQKHVADSLEKGLYAPNERLLQPLGKQRIYILKKGKLDLFVERFGDRGGSKRKLRTIEPTEGLEVSNNLHGYASVVANKPSRLVAVSSAFTTCYFLDKQAFMRCVLNNPLDKEYYHQMKDKICQQDRIQVFEVPSILNIRQHYNPSRTIVFRKYKAEMGKFFNRRMPHARLSKFKHKKHHFKMMSETKAQINDKIFFNTQHNLEQPPSRDSFDEESTLQQTQEQTARLPTLNLPKQTSTQREQTRVRQLSTLVSFATLSKDMPTPTEQLNLMFGDFLHHYLDRAIQYRNFFPANNLQHVLRRLEKENYTMKKKKMLGIRSVPRSNNPIIKKMVRSAQEIEQGDTNQIQEE